MRTIRKLFANPSLTTPLALAVMFFWGSLYPCIKLGYGVFEIDASTPGGLLLFAGVRFALCGLILLPVARAMEGKPPRPDVKTVADVLSIGLTGYVLHYTCSYIGLSMIASAKAAILKQLGSLLIICFAFLFRKEDRFTARKLASGLLGFAGVLIVNLDGMQLNFSAGDALLIAASLGSALSMIFSKQAYDRLAPLTVTAWAQLFGGAILTIAGLAMGGRMHLGSFASAGVLGYICLASCLGYGMWNLLLKSGNLTRLNEIKFAEPMFSALCSALLLGEHILRIEYLAAFIVIAAGIWVGGHEKR